MSQLVTRRMRDNRALVLNVLTGVGKTRMTLQHLATCYKGDEFKSTYAANTVLEVLEAVLGFIRFSVEHGRELANVKRSLAYAGILSFNFDYEECAADRAKVAAIMESANWKNTEKKYIRSLKCETNKYKVDVKMIFTTHESLRLHADFHSDRDVIIDEVPTWFLQTGKTKLNAARLNATHLNIFEASGEMNIDPNTVSRAICKGLIKICDTAEEQVAYYFNPRTPFKTCVILTAYADSTAVMLANKLLNKSNKTEGVAYYDVMTPNESYEALLRVDSNVSVETVEVDSVTNKDTDNTMEEMKRLVQKPSKTLVVSTGAQDVKMELAVRITTNKKGTNSYSHCNEVIVATQLNLNNAEKAMLVKVFGVEEALEIERKMAGAKLLQSIFRSAIRKGEKIIIYCCSRECELRINMALAEYRE